jgi:hypothetical protein
VFAYVSAMERTQNQLSRRSFVKATAYVAPVILTLKARAAHASVGSGDLGKPSGKDLETQVNAFVTDLRNSEHGPTSPEVRNRLVTTAQDWHASGTDRYIERRIRRTLKDLNRSGKSERANQIKEDLAHLTKLFRKLVSR